VSPTLIIASMREPRDPSVEIPPAGEIGASALRPGRRTGDQKHEEECLVHEGAPARSQVGMDDGLRE